MMGLDNTMMDHGYGGMMNGGYGGMALWMVVAFVIVIAVLAVVVFTIVRLTGPRSTSRDEARDSRDEARELLRHRYAAGEIDKDEFTSRQGDLGRSR